MNLNALITRRIRHRETDRVGTIINHSANFVGWVSFRVRFEDGCEDKLSAVDVEHFYEWVDEQDEPLPSNVVRFVPRAQGMGA